MVVLVFFSSVVVLLLLLGYLFCGRAVVRWIGVVNPERPTPAHMLILIDTVRHWPQIRTVQARDKTAPNPS